VLVLLFYFINLSFFVLGIAIIYLSNVIAAGK